MMFWGFDRATGALSAQQIIPSVPPGFTGTDFTSEIRVSADGNFVYGANRLNDTISVFKIGHDGSLTQTGHVSTLGDYPRIFAIDSSGRFMAVGNQFGRGRCQASSGTHPMSESTVQKRCPFPRWISSSPRCRGSRLGRLRSHSARNAAPRDTLCSSSRRGAPPHDWWASIDSPARSVGATVASPVPSDPRSRSARSESGNYLIAVLKIGEQPLYHADSTEPYAQARCQTDGRRCGWVAQFAQSLRWR